MAQSTIHVTCPSCHARLVAPPEATETATCPRCLAIVPLPGIEPGPPSPAAGGAIQTRPIDPPAAPIPPPEAVSPARTGPSHCPSCGKPVEPVWVFCPHCEERLRGHRHRYSDIESDVRLDSKRTRFGLGGLAMLGGIGTFWYFVTAGQTEGSRGVLRGLLGLLFLIPISTALMFYRTRNNPAERGLSRVIVGTLSLVGGTIIVFCSLAAAVVVFFFVVCLVGAMH
jgi:hypothetical protein